MGSSRGSSSGSRLGSMFCTDPYFISSWTTMKHANISDQQIFTGTDTACFNKRLYSCTFCSHLEDAPFPYSCHELFYSPIMALIKRLVLIKL